MEMGKKIKSPVGRDDGGLAAVLAIAVAIIVMIVMVIVFIGAFIGMFYSLKNYFLAFKKNVIDSNIAATNVV